MLFLFPFDKFTLLIKSGYGLTVTKLLGFLLVVMILFIFFLRIKKNLIFSLGSKLWTWFIFFFIFNFISALISDYKALSFNSLKKMGVAFLIFALTLIFVNKKSFTKTLPKVLIASISFNSFLTIAGYLFNIKLLIRGIGEQKRGSGIVGNPNDFAVLVCFILPLLSYWFFKVQKKKTKILLLFLSIINITAIILTYSRTGFLLLLITLILLGFKYKDKLRPVYLGFFVGGIVAILLGMYIFVPNSYWNRQKTLMESKNSDSSILRRFTYLQTGLDEIKKSPFIGHGPDSFRLLYKKSKFNERGGGRVAHNSYLEILVGTGLIGFLIFSIIIVLVYRNFTISQNKYLKLGNIDMFELASVYKLSFVIILLSFLTISDLYNKMFWIILGISQICFTYSEEKNPNW